MLTRETQTRGFGRRDATRWVVSVGLLVIVLAAILASDIVASRPTVSSVGDVATANILAPRTETAFMSRLRTLEARQAAREAVPDQYTYTPAIGELSAAVQRRQLEQRIERADTVMASALPVEMRRAALATAIDGLSTQSVQTLQALEPEQWRALRRELERVFETLQRGEIRDAQLVTVRDALPSRFPDTLARSVRELAAEIVGPVLIANSSYDARATEDKREAAAAAVLPVVERIDQGELLVPRGKRLTPEDIEKLAHFSLLGASGPDPARLAGWVLLSLLVVALLLGWVWRFRPQFWHRNNALLLVSLLLVAATAGIAVTRGAEVLAFVVPIAAVGLLVAVLLDSGTALVCMGVIGVVAGAVSGSVELAVYTFLGGFAGIVTIRRGERLHHFAQAGISIALVQALVIVLFTLLGERDTVGLVQLLGAAVASGGGSAVAAVGSFALLGDVFGITTAFKLLELANPTQPLLRKLLLEASGTYHHSLMVGNLAERAAEAIGADPLVARVAAYYHDVGKLANPLAFIENQGGMRNVHDELRPEQSAAILKQHVANGIDIAYQFRLPKAIIAFIPQHHGTALMSYFYAKAKAEATQGAGALAGSAGSDEAAASVDQARFRHAGPKPQSREAAILMLADGVEASVRSLTSQDEPAIRAMVDRIIRERTEDGQFDECDLTLRDLDRIREAFVAQLLGMYHRRIEYPQNKIVELESRRVAGR